MDEKYFASVEALAQQVCEGAAVEGWLTYLEDDPMTPFQRAVNELARHLRHVHYEGDGCLDESPDAEE